MAAKFPERLEHLVVLGYDVGEHAGQRPLGILRSRDLRNHVNGLSSDPRTLGKAVLALVDDYARFCAQNPDEVNPRQSFNEGLRRITKGGIRYSGDMSVIFSTERSSLDFFDLVSQRGYHLDYEGSGFVLPPMFEVSESVLTSGITVPGNGEYREKTKIMDGREVCFREFGDRMYVETTAETSYHGDGFSLHRIHSPYFQPTTPRIDTKVRGELQGIYFSLANSLMSGATPWGVIPSLETQLSRLDQAAIANPELRAEIHRVLGNCYAWCNNAETARSHYEQALSLDPEGKRLYLGKRYLSLGDPQKAASLFGAAMIHDDLWTGIRALPHYLHACYQTMTGNLQQS
ncbi:tetratricopeptide repeat protein [Candidatus Woesearchaeota archaeon]|nr:tetratricopeptide repeat protein [Candidatus Woesearchaeota archaeon]